MHALIQSKLENLDLPILPTTKATITLNLQTDVSPIEKNNLNIHLS